MGIACGKIINGKETKHMNIQNNENIDLNIAVKEFNWMEKIPIIATGLNAIGFVIIMLDAVQNWWINAEHMSSIMFLMKIVGIIFMILGTMVFCLSFGKDNNFSKIRKFLRINIGFYAIIISLIIYYLALPPMWMLIGYLVTVLLTEVILILKKA